MEGAMCTLHTVLANAAASRNPIVPGRRAMLPQSADASQRSLAGQNQDHVRLGGDTGIMFASTSNRASPNSETRRHNSQFGARQME